MNDKKATIIERLRHLFPRVVIIFVVLSALWLYGLVRFVEMIPVEHNGQEETTDAIIILTGGQERLITGIELLNKGLAKKMLVTGVGEDSNLDAILAFSDSLIPHNIEELKAHIELGYEAESTYGNANETARWMEKHGFSRLRLVTADYHIPRSLVEFKRAMPNAEIVIHPVSSRNIKLENWWEHRGTRNLLYGEFNKYIIATIRSFFG